MNRDQFLAPNLVKFMVTAAACLFVGTVQGALQVMGPIREWLISIGTPNSNPGHLIDPLAHAHINLVGGVVLFVIGMIYYHFPRMSGKRLYSNKLVETTYWFVTLGVCSFYISLVSFGIIEGNMLLDGQNYDAIHVYYGPVISICASIMTIGYGAFFVNITLSAMQKIPERNGADVSIVSKQATTD